ncbi:hypothetical protein GOARA_091_00200 [Gordonia araii NBRC 100433]|uniref:EccD-like transmembrane domain-containing protein n=1 Tax=Gordonia araii NBRC 100433 TaxID=1073574 RepID=G7H7S7_9ACTN|nr:type VII secretion integral membrane protein EccD [Gordonia araii]NNG95657.1 type VII secretion integral membrane protein EccD [Gordonia araii NBRC 100433]GAB11902.1 hypothetical protein GOARA_091_00200 [Gordonia araii NBRC 100433]
MPVSDPLADLDQSASGADPELTRISVLGGNTQLDIGLPGSVPISSLLADLVALIESRNPDLTERENEAHTDVTRHHWVLGRVGADPIDSSRTLDEAGVVDGDLLVLRSVDSREAPVLFDDVIDAVAQLNSTNFPSWTVATARTMGYCVAMIACVLAGVALLFTRAHTDAWWPGFAAVGAGIAFLVAAIITARYYRDSTTATVLCTCAQPLVFAGAMVLTPGSYGAPHLLFGAAASLLTAVIAYRTTGAGPMVHAAVITGAILGIGATGISALWHTEPVNIGAGMAAVGFLLVATAARFTILLARLPLPPVPTAGAPIDPIEEDVRPTIEGIGAIGAMALPSAGALERRAKTANAYLSGILIGATGIAGIGAFLAADPTNGFQWKSGALAIIIAIVLARRGRAYSDVTQAAVLIGGGALTFAALMIGYATSSTTGALTAFGLLVGLAILGAVTRVIGDGEGFSPVAKRTGEIIEYILVGLIVPLAFWVMDVYGYVRDL